MYSVRAVPRRFTRSLIGWRYVIQVQLHATLAPPRCASQTRMCATRALGIVDNML